MAKKKRNKNRRFMVSMKLDTGMVMKREIIADDAACALGAMIDSFSEEPAFVTVSVVPLLQDESTTVQGEKAAAKAVKRLLSDGFSHELCNTGVLDAYAAAIAEGRA